MEEGTCAECAECGEEGEILRAGGVVAEGEAAEASVGFA